MGTDVIRYYGMINSVLGLQLIIKPEKAIVILFRRHIYLNKIKEKYMENKLYFKRFKINTQTKY